MARVAIQLLLIPKLSEKDNFWLHYLTNHLHDARQAEELIRKYSENKDDQLYKSVMDIIVRANKSKFEEAKEVCEALEELMEDKLKEREERGIECGIERGIEQGIERGLDAFIQDNMEEHVSRERIIQKLMKRFKLTEEKAEQYYIKFGK